MLCFPELYYSAENWLCLTEFDWCGSLDTMESMGMRRPTHLQEQDQVLFFGVFFDLSLMAGPILSFYWVLILT
jgi:hypothetical protein